jgi:hypothetical protein
MMNSMQNAPGLSRRQLLRSAAFGAAAVSLSRFAIGDQPATRPADFSFVCMGDLHLDQLAHHDMDWLRREKPNDIRQVENYSRITSEITPKLFGRVRQTVATLPGTPFVLQLGDLVEGLCGTPALARRHCEDALGMIHDARFNAPLLFVKGNHDITGPGAVEAFDEVLLPSNKHPSLARSHGANFTVDVGTSRFVFFDAYQPDEALEWLTGALEGRGPDSGATFFVVHPPVVPYTGRCWHVFNRPNQQEKRSKLLAMLADANVIVLNGHLHRYGLVTRTLAARRFEQFSVLSVVPDLDPKVRDELVGRDAYGAAITDLEPKFSPTTLDDRRQTLENEKEFVTRYEHANTAGYAVIHVRGQDVTADYYRGVGGQLWRSVQLSQPRVGV